MGERVKATLDDDVYDSVLEEHRRTGKSKSQIVNDRTRKAYQNGQESLDDTFLPVFGQALFIVGFVIAFYASMLSGIGVSLLGGAMMIGSNVDHQLQNGADGVGEALRKSIGV
jgi:Flp pilus assembly protein TadB